MDEDLAAILRAQREKIAKLPPPSPDEVKRAEEQARENLEALAGTVRQLVPLPEISIEPIELEVPPKLEGVLADLLPAERPRKPAHRMPEGIPIDTMRRVKALLEQGELSQQDIADAVGLDRSRIQRHKALRLAGWDLIRSHPDFRSIGANDGLVYLPSLKEVPRLLGIP